MNEKEKKILSFLRKDARCSASQIALELQIPLSTMYDHISKMVKDGKIRKYTVIMNFPKVDLHYHHCLILHSETKTLLLDFLQQQKSVNYIKEIQDGFLIETLHSNLQEYTVFVQKLPQYTQEFQEHRILADVARESIGF